MCLYVTDGHGRDPKRVSLRGSRRPFPRAVMADAARQRGVGKTVDASTYGHSKDMLLCVFNEPRDTSLYPRRSRRVE
jgi:hypothetical protein